MKALKHVLFFVRNYKATLVVTIASMLLLVGVQLLIPWIIKTMVGAVTNPSGSEFSYTLVTRLALLALWRAYVARAILQFLRSYIAHVAGWGVVADVRKQVYAHLQRLSLRYYEDKQTGQLMSRAVNDTHNFELLIAHAIPDIIVNVLTLVGVTIVLMAINWRLALFSMLPIPVVLFSLRAFANYVRPAFRDRQQELGELNAILNDNLSGIREIKAFTREKTELNRVWVRTDRYRDSLLYALKMLAIFQPFVQFSSSLGTIVVIYFGGRMILNQTLPIEDLVAFFLYLELFYQPLHHLSDAWEKIQEAVASADRVAEILDEEPDIVSPTTPIRLPARAEGNIRFQDVGFAYLSGEQVLQSINLDIPAHTTTALVGPTGVGKSTLASLIPRFYDVSSGNITLDDVDLRQLDLQELRKQISIVLQDVFLFHGTARDNILFGRENASEAEVIQAAEIANAHKFICQLPQGYDTLIGERGVKLSGGQKQRLSIARAVLKDSPLLILDEATSSVDAETEALIQQALERLMVGRTTVIIAHRLSTVRNADQIVVLGDKSVVERGTHDELMALNGHYWQLNHAQRMMESRPFQTNGASSYLPEEACE